MREHRDHLGLNRAQGELEGHLLDLGDRAGGMLGSEKAAGKTRESFDGLSSRIEKSANA